MSYFIRILFLFIVGVMVASVSCNNGDSEPIGVNEKKLQETLVKVNKKTVKIENQQIDDYVARHQWQLITTESGLRYQIYQKGIGKIPIKGSTVSLEYEISDIRGNLLYSSKRLGKKIFVVDNAEEPSGLHEAVKLLKLGARAKLIIPSYLAYGFVGDDDKIGRKTTLIYDVYLVEVR